MLGRMALLQTLEIETGPDPVASFIILHGLGADGSDFAPFADELDLAAVGPVRFILPNAPVMPVTINNGYRMPAWFDILSLELPRREDEEGLRRSQADIEAIIARENERGIPSHRIVLGGFSQGCAMTLLTGLRHKERLAGLVGMSGFLPLAGKTADERSDANALTPIFVVHGRQDPVIPLDRAIASRDVLTGLGYDIEWHEYAMPHSVCAQEVADLNAWLLKVLARS